MSNLLNAMIKILSNNSPLSDLAKCDVSETYMHHISRHVVGVHICVNIHSYTHTHTHNGILFSHKREGHPATCDNMDLMLSEIKSNRNINTAYSHLYVEL